MLREKRDRDWYSKIVRKDYREPTPRRDQTVGEENLRGEFQGEPEESQPTPLEDDAESPCRFFGRFKVTLHLSPSQ